MRKSMILSALIAFALTACGTDPQVPNSSPGVVIGGGGTITPTPVTPVPVQPAPATGPQVTTGTGVRVVFGASSTTATNYSSAATTVCVNSKCAELPAGYVATADTGATAVQRLAVFGAELTFNSSGSYMRPTSSARITTRRITTTSGTALQIGDNIPALGEGWTDRAGDIQQLVIEHLN